MEIVFCRSCVSILYLCMCVLGHSIVCISFWGLQSKLVESHCSPVNVETRLIAPGALEAAVLEKVGGLGPCHLELSASE